MALLVILTGLPIAPLIASRNQLVERVAPRGTATEAFTWPLTALVAGVSLGAATAGSLVEEYSWSAGVVAAVVGSSLGALVLLARRETLSARPLAARRRLAAMGNISGARSVEIEAPIERCYTIAADIDNAPDWQGR